MRRRAINELVENVKVFLCAFFVTAIFAAQSPAALAQAQTAPTVLELNLPSQPMELTLRALADKHKLQVVFRPSDVQGVMAPEMKGRFSVEGAIQRLVSGTNLTYSFNGQDTVVVQSKGATEKAGSPGGASQAGPILAQAGGSSSDIHRAESITVTARKRNERLSDVPISIAVVTKDDIDRRGLVNAEDYLRGIPGANQMEDTQGQAIVIRGIETSPAGQNAFTGPTVATYFGETPTTNSAGLAGGSNVDLKLVDIERVEILRGPQGTAFGNSSMGGAVRTIPVAPQLAGFEGKVGGGYSNTTGTGGDNYNAHAVGNIPLIKDKLAVRGVAYQFRDSGFYRNRAGSDLAFRARAVTPYGAEAFAVDEDEVGSQHVKGGRIAALFQATGDLKFTLNYLSQKTKRDGLPLANSGTFDQTLLQVAPEHAMRGRRGGFFDTNIDLVNPVMEFDFGWGNLLATYSNVRSGSRVSTPFTLFAVDWPLSYNGPSDHRAHSGEIRLATQTDGSWNFLAGLYAEELKDQQQFDYKWHGDPETNFFARGQRQLATFAQTRNVNQKAVFGEAYWAMLRDLTLTGGVRSYKYDRAFRTDADGVFYGPDGIHEGGDTKSSGTNFRANLSYKFDDRGLIYAGWSEGFRLGRPQAGLPPGVCDRDGDGIIDGTNSTIESTRRLLSDSVDSYEIGTKFVLYERRVTIAADVFRMDWTDMPVTVTVGSLPTVGPLDTSCQILGFLANAGKARSDGVELQASFQITRELRADAGGSWIRARLTENVPSLNAPSGSRLPGSPEISANLGLQYDFRIEGYKASLRFDSIYVGSFYGDFNRSPNTKSGGYVKLDASARMAVRSLNIDLFVRNLTNEDAFTFRGIFPTSPLHGHRLRPRTIGVQLGYTF